MSSTGSECATVGDGGQSVDALLLDLCTAIREAVGSLGRVERALTTLHARLHTIDGAVAACEEPAVAERATEDEDDRLDQWVARLVQDSIRDTTTAQRTQKKRD